MNNSIHNQKCFVIMPFSETYHGPTEAGTRISQAEWNHIYRKWIRRAIQAYGKVSYTCKRSPAQPGNFIRGIVQDLAEADLVIADLTGRRPNVYYELGIRHALKLGTILITQDLDTLPSDLSSYYAFEYEYSEKASEYDTSYSRFEHELHGNLNAFCKGQVVSDSPVSDFLGFRAYLMDKKGYADKENLRWMISSCKQAVVENHHICEFLYQAFVQEKEITLVEWPIIDTFPVESLMMRLASHQWEAFPDELAGGLSEILRKHRRMMLRIEQMWQVYRINPSDESVQRLVSLLHSVSETAKENAVSWNKVEDQLDKMGLALVVTDDEGEEKTVLERDFERQGF